MISFSLLYGDQGQNRKRKIKGLHKEILKTWVLHKKCCVQSVREDLKYRDIGKKKDVSTEMQKREWVLLDVVTGACD